MVNYLLSLPCKRNPPFLSLLQFMAAELLNNPTKHKLQTFGIYTKEKFLKEAIYAPLCLVCTISNKIINGG